jgi:predicted dehydrogenase
MRVVQVGVGKMGQHWLDVLIASDRVELAGIVEPVAALREAAAGKASLDETLTFDALDNALVTIDFDAAVVVTPPPTHRPIAEQLLRAGRHVLLEKPLATTIEDARALVDTAGETGRTLMVAQNYRHFEAFATIRELVAGGSIGPLRSVSIAFRREARTMFGVGDFRYSMPHVLLVDMSIHHFDMLRALTGANAARVYAQSWHVPDGVFAHDAAASALITMTDGTVVTYTGNWATHTTETSWNGEWEIVGERGRIGWGGGDWSAAEVEIQEWGAPPEPVTLKPIARSGQAGLLAAFVDAIGTGTEPDTAATDNIHSLEIVFAAVESVETGRVVELASLEGSGGVAAK